MNLQCITFPPEEQLSIKSCFEAPIAVFSQSSVLAAEDLQKKNPSNQNMMKRGESEWIRPLKRTK